MFLLIVVFCCACFFAQSGKESTLVVERYGGNMMSLHAEASPGEGDGGAAGDGPMALDSDLSFQTHVMKVFIPHTIILCCMRYT